MSSGGSGGAADGSRGSGPPDRALARRVRDGDRQAFAELVRRYLRPVHGVVASFLSEPADVEDAAQETFLRALDGIHGYDADRPFAPWLYQIARNVARNRLGAERRWANTELDEARVSAEAGDPVEEMERSRIRERVEAAIAALPEQRRTAFRLCDVEGYAAAEVAEIMGLAPGTVRSHVHHARHDLRDRLGPLAEAREEP